MFRRNKGENKAKIEHKLYLARETPEPIFDLAECDLRQVPQENNCLTALTGGGELKDLHGLKVLDLHKNAFVQLPDDIHFLKNLRELYLNDNQLKKMPETICHLSNLRILNLANNSLKALPENIGNLINLRLLNIINNKHLTRLPKSMHKNQRLTSLQLDSHNFVYPPQEVTALDAQAIIKYICEDIGADFIGPQEGEDFKEEKPKQEDQTDAFEKQKLQDFLEMEKANEILQRQEFELANAQKLDREKLLSDIAQEQNKFDMKLMQIQQVREAERFILVEQLVAQELNACKAINHLLELTREPQAQLLEQEKQEEERLLAAANKYNTHLRKNDILADMQELLRQELHRFQKFDKNRDEVSRSILEQEIQSDNRLSEVLQDQDSYKAELVSKLQEDSDFQKAAVGTLLERGDARSWGLVQQVKLVEAQLAALTHLEIDRRKLEIDEQLNDLCDKRINLSILLMELLQEQNERRSQLLSTLRILEDKNKQNADDFWLRQYQQLLEKLPEGLSEAQKDIDPALAQALLLNGVFHCLPFLAKLIQCEYDIRNITESELSEAGIRERTDRIRVIDAFHMYEKEKDIKTPFVAAASAPKLAEEASAPPPQENTGSSPENECVVCMDKNCEMIFVPCGHFCCCGACASSLVDCPMCRGAIERKIRVISS